MKAVVFDLDGTLTDSKEGIFNCVRYALEKMGEPILPDEQNEQQHQTDEDQRQLESASDFFHRRHLPF